MGWSSGRAQACSSMQAALHNAGSLRPGHMPKQRHPSTVVCRMPQAWRPLRPLPSPHTDRIMDVLLADQCECALLKVAVTIMKSAEKRLLGMADLEDILGHLRLTLPGGRAGERIASPTAADARGWMSLLMLLPLPLAPAADIKASIGIHFAPVVHAP